MGRQEYSARTWIWYKKEGQWHRGVTAKTNCFDPGTSTYKIHREGFYGRKPDNVAAQDIKPYTRSHYLDGKHIVYKDPKSGELIEGIAYHPTSPSCAEYLVAPRYDHQRLHTTKIKKKDIRLDR